MCISDEVRLFPSMKCSIDEEQNHTFLSRIPKIRIKVFLAVHPHKYNVLIAVPETFPRCTTPANLFA